MSRGPTDSKPWKAVHGFWGTYTATSELPNVSGAAEQDSYLNAGDTACVGTELYVCTVATQSGATWKLMARNDSTTAATHGGTLAVTGATTLTGGVVATTMARIPNIADPLATTGTDKTYVASGDKYYAEVFLPANKTITGIAYMNGPTVGTNKVIVALYSSAGAKLANSATAGVTTSGADAWQEVAFTATYAAVGPARYWVVLQADGTTDNFHAIAASTYLNLTGTDTADAFGTLTAITPPTTFTADVGPIAYLY